MPTLIIDTFKPKNNGNFPVVEAADVGMSDGSRLEAYLEGQKDELMGLAEVAVGQLSSINNRVTALEQNGSKVPDDLLDRVDALEARDEEFVTAAEAVVEQVQAIGGKVETLEETAASTMGSMLAMGLRLKALETPAASVNMTGFEADGTITETRSDGTTVEHQMQFDDSGVPISLTTITKDKHGEVVKENTTELVGFSAIGGETYESAEGRSF